MRLRCGDELFEPRVRAGSDGVEVVLGGRSLHVSLSAIAAGTFLVRHDGHARLFHVAQEGTRVHLFWDGVAYTLDEEREGAQPAARSERGALETPMPGRVSAVKAVAGARVAKGDELVVVEAMKMENALRAPRDGTVRAVHAAVGDMVAPGRPLVELEP
jgi:acetyl/propionyl-CoA carboxylase alpha subunit